MLGALVFERAFCGAQGDLKCHHDSGEFRSLSS